MKVGVLHIDQQFLHLKVQHIWSILKQCADAEYCHRLYVALRPSPIFAISPSVFEGLSNLYNQAFRLNAHTDVRIFLENLKTHRSNQAINQALIQPNVLFTDQPSTRLPDNFRISPLTTVIDIESPINASIKRPNLDVDEWKTYNNVVIGGTFDHLHAGHKLLLSNAILRCNKKLTIGITVQEMLKKKRLADLIQPLEERQRVLQDFCSEVDASLEYNIVPIVDPFGPSTVDPDLEAIVVSEETLEGGNAVNLERQKKHLGRLQVHTFPVNDIESSSPELRTISSSWYRQQMLGRLLRPPERRPDVGTRPYLIGLTGGSGSGKSSIGAHLSRKPGVLHIDCDKIAHQAYRKGTGLFERLTTQYGQTIVDQATGEIARKELGKIVFSSQVSRQKLNELIWPEVMNYCLTQIKQAQPKVAVIDAALLIEAGWSSSLDETWVAFVPEDEAVKRIVNRDLVGEEYARARITSQMSNRERIAHANVVFCSIWDYSVTHGQVDQAWNELLLRV